MRIALVLPYATEDLTGQFLNIVIFLINIYSYEICFFVFKLP